MTTPRIYVACLASYNAGKLHGAWIDCADADTMRDDIATMLRESPEPNVLVKCAHCDGTGTVDQPKDCGICKGTGKVPSAEECAIHDYEGFCGLKLSEYAGLESVAALAELIEETDDEDLVAAASSVADMNADADELRSVIQDRYQGCHDSLADWAESLCEDIYSDSLKELPDFIKYHIDWEAVAERELIMGGDYSYHRHNGSFYIFDNNA